MNNNANMETLHGTWSRTTFTNAEKGRVGFFLKPSVPCGKGYETEYGGLRCVGECVPLAKGTPISVTGTWRKTEFGNGESGYELVFKPSGLKLHAEAPIDAKRYVANTAPQLGFRAAAAIVESCNIFATAMQPEERWNEVAGMAKADPAAVKDFFTELRSVEQGMMVYNAVQSHGGSYADWDKIVKAYPDDAVKALGETPYEVARKAKCNFNLIDRIALDEGFAEFCDERIGAIVVKMVQEETNSGNCYMTAEQICKKTEKALNGLPATAVMAALSDNPWIVRDPGGQDRYYLKESLSDEVKAAREFARLTLTRFALPLHPELVDKIEAENGHPFGEQQRESFGLLDSTGIKLFTGGPGTGKTTTVNGLLRYVELVWMELFHREPKFALCAPSGRAAQRMKETTNRNALTVHKLIEYVPYGDDAYYKNAQDPIDADVVVVDEVSMLGLSTFTKLIAAIKSGTLVLLVGDTNQLQSVEPGNVLYDLIHSGYLPMVKLTQVFRQKADSFINVNANKILVGDVNLGEGADFEIIRTSPETTKPILEQRVRQMILEAGEKNRVQVLSPAKSPKGGSCSVSLANPFLQEIFNPAEGTKGPAIHFGSTVYRLGDRVMMQSNNYALNYFNGDVGYVTAIGAEGSSMTLQIGENEVKVPKEKFCDASLAYSCTVHKSQGSEYDFMIMTLQKEAGPLLNRNLLYTGVTRGKKKCVIISEGDALERAVANGRKEERRTALSERIGTAVSEAIARNAS